MPNPRVVKKPQQHGALCATAAPVWHELVSGSGSFHCARRAALEEYLQAVVRRPFPILPYDEVAADWHRRERARLEEAGKTAPFADGQIAAIAFTRGLTLVTANTKDFRFEVRKKRSHTGFAHPGFENSSSDKRKHPLVCRGVPDDVTYERPAIRLTLPHLVLDPVRDFLDLVHFNVLDSMDNVADFGERSREFWAWWVWRNVRPPLDPLHVDTGSSFASVHRALHSWKTTLPFSPVQRPR
jgi:tRNA(fMet)-specific endonuclease VapC